MNHPYWFDYLIYRIFRWRWNPILKNNPHLAVTMGEYMINWAYKKIGTEYYYLAVERAKGEKSPRSETARLLYSKGTLSHTFQRISPVP